MKYEEFKGAVIKAAEAAGIEEYELYYSSNESVSVDAFRHEINEFSSSVEGGVCFRCMADGKMGYASTQDLTEAEASELVRRACENAEALETDEKEFLGTGGKTYQKVNAKECPIPETDELISAVLEGQKCVYEADPSVVDGSTSSALAIKGEIAIYNSRGLDLSHSITGTGFVSSAVVMRDGEMNNAYEVKIKPFEELDIKAVVGKAVAEAVGKLGADAAPTGSYPVVFAPKAMAALLATFASSFSSENAMKGLSRLKDREGEKIAADIVTIMDDPFYPENIMQVPFDAEGTPSYTKAVIEKGELKTLLYNLKTAALTGRETTGNAAKGGYDKKVEIQPFTMYIKHGDTSEEELLKKAGSGVYIDSLQGMHAGANPITGDFSLQSAGFMIENGEKTRPVKAFTVAGNFFDLLKSITALGDKEEIAGFGASVTAFASPAVLAGGLSIAGK